MQNKGIYIVSGIDTDIGKTIATGLIARGLLEAGVRVITMKAVQTGCDNFSEDIVKHRQLMGCQLLPEDTDGLTCPYIFNDPCSPHLAAKRQNETIDPARIGLAAAGLQQAYDIVLLEGAGGLFVPLTEDYTLIDFMGTKKYPVILVTSSRLGSINHTLASLEALRERSLTLAGVVYNRFANETSYIAEDSLYMIRKYLNTYGFAAPLVEMEEEERYSDTGDCRHFAALCLN